MNMPLFEKLGIADKVAQIGMIKPGIEFVSPDHDKNVVLDFARAWDAKAPHSFQVRRSVFDHLLLQNAADKGATVIEECRANAVEFTEEGVTVTAKTETGEEKTWRARFLVDATGRDTLLANRFGKQRDRHSNSAAVYGSLHQCQTPGWPH